jgi:hypothetical protein
MKCFAVINANNSESSIKILIILTSIFVNYQ